jgi:HK97 family phage portal protein
MKIPNPFRRRAKTKEKGWALTQEGMLNTSWDLGWWQQNLKPLQPGVNETVEACISTLSQTVAMCPIALYLESDDGSKKRRYGANPERVLKFPNKYQTRSAFFNNLIRAVYFEGNGYAVATRDERGAVSELHLVDPRATRGIFDPETNEVYYWVSPNWGAMQFNPDTDQVYPARDILNVRINASQEDPLKGITPLAAARNSVAANSAIIGHQAAFYNNMARPSGTLVTDQQLTLEQMKQLREAWAEQSKGLNSGGVPVLGNGLKWQPLTLNSQDAQTVEAMGMTIQNISSVFRVPPQMINDLSQNTTFNNAETMNNWFLSSGLGFLLEHIELELDRLFSLPFNQHLNFNTRALLRTDEKSMVETLGEGVRSGIYAPNEARNIMGLSDVEYGDEPRVQQQVVPLSWWEDQAALQAQQPAAPAEEPVTEASMMEAIRKGMDNAA